MFSKYNCVYQVYKECNFTRAAEKLFISQPSLSAAVKNIEKKIGAELFERCGKSVKLTEIGREYISAAERIMNIENEFSNKLNDIYNLETGKITVGGTNYMSSYIIPQIINRFASKYPKIEVVLADANSATLSTMLKNEELDVVIDSFDESMDEYQGYPLLNEDILLCVPKDRAINAKLKRFQIEPESICDKSADLKSIDAVPIEMFKDEKFIMLKKGNDMYSRAMNVFLKNNIIPNVALSVDQLNISYTLSESGMGLCFLTDTFFKYGKFRGDVVLYKVESKHCTRTLYIVHKRNKYCTKAMTEFVKIAKEVIN